MTNALTPRGILQKPSQPVEEKEKRYAWVVCPVCRGRNSHCCQFCAGMVKVKAELIRLAPGSKAKGGAKTPKRTTADAKHSNAVRERDGWKCTLCGKDFSDNHGGLQAAHYVKRRYKALRKGYTAHTGDGCCLRHSLDNALSLCISDHMLLENNSTKHELHFRPWFGDAHCDALKEESQKGASKRVGRSA